MKDLQLVGIIIQLAALVGYLGYCLAKFGLTDTISATWYEHKTIVGKIFFTAFLVLITIPIMFFIPEASKWGWVIFLGVLGVVLVSVAPDYKKHEFISTLHVWGAIAGAVLVLTGIWLVFGALWPVLVTAGISVGAWLLKLKGATYYAELATMLMAIGFEIQTYLS